MLIYAHGFPVCVATKVELAFFFSLYFHDLLDY